LKLLRENNDKNLILIYSPAGYGKTTLVQDFLKKHKNNAAWLSVTEEIEHIYTFFTYIINSLAKLNQSFGKNTLELIESRRQKFQLSKNVKSLASEIVTTFVNEFAKYFKDEVTLVIDDLQHIEESKWVITTFNSLIENLPSNLHLILITRQIPDFNFLPALLKGRMLKIGIEELLFRNNEIADLIEKIYSFDYTKEGIKLLENNIGGWITGIHMVLQSYGPEFEKLKIDSQKIPENLFNFLAETIFNQLDKECQNFMLNTALLDSFNEDICTYLLGSNNVSLIIKKLSNKNLLVLNSNGNSDRSVSSFTYCYQVLFRKFLKSKLYEMSSQDSIKLLKQKILDYYQSKGDAVSALSHMLAAKDFTGAVPIIIQNFQRLFNEGKFEFLWKWLSSIDEETVIQNPHLIYYLGILYKFFVGDLETSLQYLQRAIVGFKEQNDPQNLIGCYINKASVLLNLGRVHEALDELTDLLKEETSPENKAKLLYFLAFAYYQNSQYDMAVNLLNQSIELSTRENIEEIRRNSFILLGHINLIKGEYMKSIKFYEHSLDINPNVLDRFETKCNLVLLHSQSGNWGKAKEFLNKLSDMMNNFPSPILRIPYLLAKQAYLFECGKYEENITVLNEIQTIATAMHHSYYVYLSHRLLSDTYYHMNEFDRAQVYYEYACSAVDESNELEKMELAVVKALLKKRIDPDPAGEFILILAYDYYKNHNLEYSKVQVSYHLADFYHKAGKHAESMKYFEDCLRISKEKDYISHLYREFSHSDEMFEFALGNKIEEEFINKLKVSRLEAVQDQGL